MNLASFKGMVPFFTIKTKYEATESASSLVNILVNMSYLSTTRQWTPSHVIHLGNGIVQWKLLIFLHQFLIKVQVLDIKIIEHLATWGISTPELRNLPIIHLLNNHFPNTLSAEVMLTAWHEEELLTELVPLAYSTYVLLLIKKSPVAKLSLHYLLICTCRVFELDSQCIIFW